MTPQAIQPLRTPNSTFGSGSTSAWTTTERPITSSGLPVPTDIVRNDVDTSALPSVPATRSGSVPVARFSVLPGTFHTGPALAAFGELQLPTAWMYRLCGPG